MISIKSIGVQERAMIDYIALLQTVVTSEGIKKLLRSLGGDKTQIQKSYESAFQNTVAWYEKKYGKKYGEPGRYGKPGGRFFDYAVSEQELAKLTFLRPEPDLQLISQLPIQTEKAVPPEVIREFAEQLRKEMGKIRECEQILVEREKLYSVEKIANNADQIAQDIRAIRKAVEPSVDDKVGGKPLDWRELYAAFKRRRLDMISIKHVGGGLQGPEMLELKDVFFAQDAGKRVLEASFALSRQKPKKPELITEFLRFAETWEAHLWHYVQEHRGLSAEGLRPHEQEDQIAHKVITDFMEIYQQQENSSDSGNFESMVQKTAQQANLSPQQVLAILRNLLEGTIKREPVLQQLQTPCSALLVGDAGVGKTTVMRMLSLKLFENLAGGKDDKAPIPLFVRLDKIAEHVKEDQSLDEAEDALFAYICQHWKPDLQQADDLTAAGLDECKQRIQLILDGLDEVPSEKLRLKLAEVANQMIRKRALHIIITSRPSAVCDSLIRTLGFTQLRLLELTKEQADRFVRNFLTIYHGRDKQKGGKDSAAFLSALELSEAAQEFAGNPLYLTVMILMHKKHEVLPKKRLELYEEFYTMLLLQRSTGPVGGKMADKPIFEVPIPKGQPIIWREDTYTPLLQRIAYLTHSNDQDSVSVSADQIIKAVQQQKLQEEIKGIGLKDLAPKFTNFADEDLGVLVSRGPFYGFSHRSLQEFLTAKRLARFDESQQVKDFWTNVAVRKPDRWLEVARLLFSEIRTKDFLFSYLEAQWPRDIADTKDDRVISMIGAIFFDLDEYYQGSGGIKTLREGVANALKTRRMKSYEFAQIFLACGDALGQMDEPKLKVGDPAVIHFNQETFDMGSNYHNDEKPIHRVQLSPYWLGKYPVTNKEFAAFINDGGYEQERFWHGHFGRFKFDGRDFLKGLKEKAPRFWLDERFGKKRPLSPVVGVSWLEAMAYCCWWTEKYAKIWAEQHNDGRSVVMRLPTEAEWEHAARGREGRKYPWGNSPAPDNELANWDKSGLRMTTAIGSYPKGATPQGVFDLAGNVWEWCYDGYDEKFYAQCQAESKKTGQAVQDPIDASRRDVRALRGGSWALNIPFDLRGSDRSWDNPDGGTGALAFACACPPSCS